jgi:hypothetical protein
MEFNHFLVRDEEPLLFHAGLKGMFPALREAVAKIIDPAKPISNRKLWPSCTDLPTAANAMACSSAWRE